MLSLLGYYGTATTTTTTIITTSRPTFDFMGGHFSMHTSAKKACLLHNTPVQAGGAAGPWGHSLPLHFRPDLLCGGPLTSIDSDGTYFAVQQSNKCPYRTWPPTGLAFHKKAVAAADWCQQVQWATAHSYGAITPSSQSHMSHYLAYLVNGTTACCNDANHQAYRMSAKQNTLNQHRSRRTGLTAMHPVPFIANKAAEARRNKPQVVKQP